MVEGLISNVEKSGLLPVADIDARKNGMEIGGDRILVFRSGCAVRLWKAEAGVEIPGRIHIRGTSGGYARARYEGPSEMGAGLDPVFAGILEGE